MYIKVLSEKDLCFVQVNRHLLLEVVSLASLHNRDGRLLKLRGTEGLAIDLDQ